MCVKKYFIMIVMTVLLLVPLGVHAATSIAIKSDKACLDADDFCRNTAKVYITTDDLIAEPVVADVTLASGVTIEKVESSTAFTVTNDGTKITFAPVDGTYTGDNKETLIGTVTFKYASTLADCSVKFNFTAYNTTKDVTITAATTTPTGAALPLAILGTAAVAGIGIYLVTKRNTKMYKI